MDEIKTTLENAMAALTLWEAVAVLFGIAYLLLAMRENILCWYAAFISTAISIFVFWNVSLIMESALQVYYLGMAVYGWYQWKYGGRKSGSGLPITRWRLPAHLWAFAGTLLIAGLSGFLLDRNTDAAWPYLDSFTTWGAVLTTYMVAKKVLENWLYWIVIDGLSVFLYLDRGLYLYALLFVAYLAIVVFGFFEWRRSWLTQSGTP